MNTQQEKILKEFHALYQKYGIPSEKRLTEWLSTALQEVAEKARKETEKKVAYDLVRHCKHLKDHHPARLESLGWKKYKLSSKEGEGK